jgi:putative transposon-encoded protein
MQLQHLLCIVGDSKNTENKFLKNLKFIGNSGKIVTFPKLTIGERNLLKSQKGTFTDDPLF